MDVSGLAEQRYRECARAEQSARAVDADRLRAAVRRLARRDGLRVRTAFAEGVVVVVRPDAQVWHDRADVMRAELAPPS